VGDRVAGAWRTSPGRPGLEIPQVGDTGRVGEDTLLNDQ